MIEILYFTWLSAGSAVSAAVVGGLFWAAVPRPSRIHRPRSFRMAAVVAGLSVVATAVMPVVILGQMHERQSGVRLSEPLPLSMYLFALPQLLLGTAIYLGIVSVIEPVRGN